MKLPLLRDEVEGLSPVLTLRVYTVHNYKNNKKAEMDQDW